MARWTAPAAEPAAAWRRPGRAILYADPVKGAFAGELEQAGLTPSGAQARAAAAVGLRVVAPGRPPGWHRV